MDDKDAKSRGCVSLRLLAAVRSLEKINKTWEKLTPSNNNTV